MKLAKLNEISVGGKGTYGIAASAVDRCENLYTYLRITDICDDGTLNRSGLKSVDDPDAAKYILKPNDIVFARTGGSTGRNYFYDGSDGEFVYAGFLIKFSIDPEKANPKYIKYYCQSSQYKNWVRSFNTGSTRGNINAQTFGNMEIPLPERAQQDFLVDVLSPIDEKIKINQQINDNLQQQVYALFDSWFVSFDQTDGKMPADWREGTLGEITTITSGKRPPMKQPTATTEVSIPLVGAASIMGFTNAVLYNEPILVTGRVGTHGVVQRFQSPCWTSDNTLVIKSEFYEYAFQALQRVDYVNMNRGSTQPLITQTDLKNVSIVIPTEAILLEYEKIAGTLMAMYESNRKENERLAVLRDTLLPRLMNGEIDVSNIEI